MKRTVILLIVCWYICAALAPAQAQRPSRRQDRDPHRLHLRKASPAEVPQSRLLSRVPQLPASATKNVVVTSCPPEAVGAVCGYVPVPLDRHTPDRGTISIYFELYSHTGSGPAESAILFNEGGPGATTTGWRADAFYLFGQNLATHDLLLIDDRGRGGSEAIDCEELQHGTAPFPQAEADCASQLGAASSRYGTGDVAKDTDAVRAALGYDKVDYYGWSYGGADVVAYAARFGEHLRSVVLDAPYAGRVISKFGLEEHYRTGAMSRMLRLDCLRSPNCSADHPSPDDELKALIRFVRLHPVEGDAFDANGTLVHVRVDETFLLNYLVSNPTWFFGNTGELLAAAASVERGDPAPLLRLAAEGYAPMELDYGDPALFSAGAWNATFCVDAHLPWKWSAPVAVRESQFAGAVSRFPVEYFAPFSKTSATSLAFSLSKQCLWWEKPTSSSPVVPPHATFPYVPVLIFAGDLDSLVPIEAVRDVAEIFSGSSQVVVAEAGHGSVWRSQCAANLASQFVETLQVGDISCTQTPETTLPAVGRFPRVAREARPAEVEPAAGNQIGMRERKVVTVAVAAATDALQRSMIGFGDGVGLRGGTFHTDYGSSWTTTLTDVLFTGDVTVNGTITWEPFGSFAADLTVSGAGSSGGTLHVEGAWLTSGPVGKFRVTGALGAKQIAALVPEA